MIKNRDVKKLQNHASQRMGDCPAGLIHIPVLTNNLNFEQMTFLQCQDTPPITSSQSLRQMSAFTVSVSFLSFFSRDIGFSKNSNA